MEAITETTVPVIDERLLKHGYAPGQYFSRCLSCNAEIEWVDKRCRTCKRCADLFATRAEAENYRSLIVQLEGEVARLKEWRSIKNDPPASSDISVLLYSPPENLSVREDQKPDFRVCGTRYFRWATHWKPLPDPPIK